MGEQLNLEKKPTVGSLLLHAIVLLIFAAAFVSMELQQGVSPLSGLNFTPIAFFLTMAVIAIWLSSLHYRLTVRTRYLLLWATFHIFSVLYVLYMSSLQPPLQQTDFSSLLLSLFVYIIPPVLIIVFAFREQT
jgi:hypothetical protein